MNTKARVGFFGQNRGAFWPDYEDNRSADMIQPNQLKQLTDYVMSQYNDSEDEKRDKIDALSELTQIEAEDYLFEVSRWQ